MAYNFVAIIAFLLALAPKPASKNAPAATAAPANQAYSYGETVTYKVRYNLYFNVDVGEVTFKIADKPVEVAGKPCYHIQATGKTYSFYDNFYKVRDKYESFVHTESKLPLVFIRNIEEGGFKMSEHVYFNHETNKAKSTKRVQSIPAKTQDVLSAIYHARTLDYANARVGQNFYMNAFIDDSAYFVGVKYMGLETIKTSNGKFRCIKLEPILVVDRIFDSEDAMTMWVTDDANRIPVRIESGISVGAIRADLARYEGLHNPMIAKLK